MVGIARFVMQGPRQALILAVLFAALPMMYWASAAITALVILRQGTTPGINVLLAALLPGIAWYAAQQEITVIAVLLGTAIMAVVLRQTVSLANALIASWIVGAGTVLLLPVVSEQWYAMLEQGASVYLDAISKQMPEAKDTIEPWVLPMLLGGVSALMQVFSIGSLLLARYWQAKLYNPGGFSQEFHQLRLPYWYTVAAILVLLVGISSVQFVAWVPLVLVPFFISGISVVHCIVKKKKMSSQWLFMFYVSLVFFLPYMYALLILVALLDALVDIRKRLKDTA